MDRFEKHEKMEQTIHFHIEGLLLGLKGPVWVDIPTAACKSKGKFAQYDPSLKDFIHHASRVPEFPFAFVYTDEAVAVQLAKALARFVDVPLRVSRVQNVRVFRQIGKTILPVGGV